MRSSTIINTSSKKQCVCYLLLSPEEQLEPIVMPFCYKQFDVKIIYIYIRDLSVCRLSGSRFLSDHAALAPSETNACTCTVMMYDLCRSVDLRSSERMSIYRVMKCMWDIHVHCMLQLRPNCSESPLARLSTGAKVHTSKHSYNVHVDLQHTLMQYSCKKQ